MNAMRLIADPLLHRFAAMMLDGFILITLSLPILVLFGRGDLSMVLSFLLSVLYHAYAHASQRQATPGEQILRLYVVRRTDGGRLSFRQSLERSLAYIMPYLPQYASDDQDWVGMLILLLVFCWFAPILFTRSQSGLHDMLCDSRVVKGRI